MDKDLLLNLTKKLSSYGKIAKVLRRVSVDLSSSELVLILELLRDELKRNPPEGTATIDVSNQKAYFMNEKGEIIDDWSRFN